MSGAVHQVPPTSAPTREARLDALLLRDEIEERNAAYSAALDRQDLTGWVTYFTADAFYVVISRENHDAGLPVGLIYCEGQKMIHDRAFALLKTSMFGPRYLRHLVGRFSVEPMGKDGTIVARANYVVLR